MRTTFLPGLLVLCAFTARMAVCAQDRTLNVLVLDSTDERPVTHAEVIGSDGHGHATDENGAARITWQGTFPFTVSVKHTGYVERTFTLTRNVPLKADTWVVHMVPKNILLAPVGVGRPAPELVFERPDLHAADLLINEEGIWVLAYEHPRMVRSEEDARKEILRNVRLVLLDSNYAEIASCPVPEDVFGLRQDLRHDVLVEGTTRAFAVGRKGTDIVLQPFGLEELRSSVLPWTDSIPGQVLGSRNDAVLPAVDHLAFDPVTDSTVLICSVMDTLMMDLFRSSYKYMTGHDKVVAMDLASELHLDKAVVAGYMSGFQHNVWFKPVYAPLFVAGDTLLVFDRSNARMRKFTRDLRSCGHVSIPYLTTSVRHDGAQRILQDGRTQRLYALFGKNGILWLRPIDPVNGSLGTLQHLTFPYPERVQVHGGYVYYIHRPYGSLQKRSIYREPIN